MEIAKLVLSYIDALVWPAFFLYLVIKHRGYIERFFERFSEETEEVTWKPTGITAKFRKEIEAIVEEIPDEQKILKDKLELKTQQLAIEQFTDLCQNFFKKPFSIRKQTAKLVEELAKSLSLDHILEFSTSSNPGERVGAGISLRIHLINNDSIVDNDRVKLAIADGISDPYSRVRFRYLEALRNQPLLIGHFADQLREIASEDLNEVVRHNAKILLRAI